jgi:hypothetical protein
MTSDERGKEVTEALQWGVDRETISVIRAVTERLDIPAGTILNLARELHNAWPGRPDADRQRAMEAHVARATARFQALPPPPQPQPSPASLPPGATPAQGFGKASDEQVNRRWDFWAQLRETQSRDTRGEARPAAFDWWGRRT